MLLRQEFGVPRVQLQQLLDILQLGLGILDLRVDAFQRGLEFGSVAAISTVIPLILFAMTDTSPPNGMEKARR